MMELIVKDNDANQRIDKFLLKTFPNLPKSKMYKSIRNKKIKVNRKRCTFDQKLNVGDHILIFLPPDFLHQKEHVILEAKPLDIIYEDQNILIVNKPSGLLSQSDEKQQDCLVSRIQSYLYKKGDFDLNEHSFAPTICHRLDRNTSGLVIAAKNASALRNVNESISKRKIKKYYKAKIEGDFVETDFYVSLYIKKEGTIAKVSDVKKEGYKIAKMHIKYMEPHIYEVELETGRFHQIRASFSYLGHPLQGDRKYGSTKNCAYELEAYKLDLTNLDIPLEKKIFRI